MRVIIIGIALAIAAHTVKAQGAQRPDPARPVILRSLTVGCSDQADLIKFAELFSDRQAATRFITPKVSRSECRIFDKGDVVFIMQVSDNRLMVQVRKRGDPDYYWAPMSFFE